MMKSKPFEKVIVLLSFFCIGLIGCAGNESKLEKARYLLGSGEPSDAIKAASEVEGLVENATGEFRVEVVEVYSGALLSSAGFNGISMLVNILHREEGASVASVLRSIFDDQENALQNVNTAVLEATEVVGTVTSGDLSEPLLAVSAELQAEYGFTSISQMADFSELSEDYQKRAYYAAGIGNLYRALFILLKVSGFGRNDDEEGDNFRVEDCVDFLQDKTQTGGEGVDAISLSLYRSDSYLSRAGLDDSNKLRQIIDDIQGGTGSSGAIDAGGTGFIGGDATIPPAVKAGTVCDYLNDSL